MHKVLSSISVVLLVLFMTSAACADTLTVSSTAGMTNVNRIGVNLGTEATYADSNFQQNMLTNPGFEEGVEGHTIIVQGPSGGATSGTFSDQVGTFFGTQSSSSEKNGFWVGAQENVKTGADAGATFAVTAYTQGTHIFVNGCTESRTTVTCTTLVPHQLVAGQAIAITGVSPPGYDGSFTVLSTGLTVNQFRYTARTANMANGSGGGLGNPVTAASESGNTVTITAVNNFAAGQTVLIEKMTPTGYNGTFQILSTGLSSSAFQVTNGTGGLAAATAFGDAATADFYTYGSCSPSCAALANGDGIGEEVTGVNVAGQQNLFGGWSASDTHTTLSTASPYEGNASLAYDVSDGASHNRSFVWDDLGKTKVGVCSKDNNTPCTAANATADCGTGNTCNLAPQAGPFHSIVGAYEIDFFAKAVNTTRGGPHVTVSLTRDVTGVNVSHTFNLTNDGAYHQYTFSFTGNDTAASAGHMLHFTMAAVDSTVQAGATIYIDDAYVGRSEASSTGWRDEVVNTLKAMNPGSLRYMGFNTIDQNDANFEGLNGGATSCTPGAIGRQGYVSGGCDYLKGDNTSFTGVNDFGNWVYSSSDAVALAGAVGAVPLVTISNVMSDSDLKAFIDHACTAISTYNFPTYWIEQSNEDWNAAAGGVKYGGSNSTTYGKLAGRNFYIMNQEATADCPSLASRFHYIIGNQACNSGVVSTATAGARQQTGCGSGSGNCGIPNTSQYGSDEALYNGGGSNNSDHLPAYTGTIASQASQYATNFFAAPTGLFFGASNKCVPADLNAVRNATGTGSNSNNTLITYETGAGALNGPGTPEQSYLAQAGFPSAGWMAEIWILAQQASPVGGLEPLQNIFDFSQIEFTQGITSPVWGITHDLTSEFGPTFPHLRPIALAMELMNRAIGGSFSSMPSYFPVNASSAAGVYANAYQLGSQWTAVLVNSNSTSQAVTVQFPASGTVPTVAQTVNYTNGLQDNNENSRNVTIGPLAGGASVNGQNVSATLPPFSVVALVQGISQLPKRTPKPKSTRL